MIHAIAAAGADLNEVQAISLTEHLSPMRVTPLMVACGSPDGASADTVSLLLQLGADPSRVIEGRSAATFAFEGFEAGYAAGGDAARAKLILDAGCPLPSDPWQRNQLLCTAARWGDLERVALLMRHGLLARGVWDSWIGTIEAQKSKAENEREVLQIVLRSMPESLRDSMAQRFREHLERESPKSEDRPCWLDIPLFAAAESGNAACMALLIEAGADPLTRDCEQHTAMYHARSVEVVRLLQLHGVNIEERDSNDWSALRFAIQAGDSDCAKALIEAGAEVNAKDTRGETPFLWAVGDGRQPELLRFLVQSGADPFVLAPKGSNAFFYAININGEANREPSVRDTFGYLKQLGLDINHRNQSGGTPLSFAVESGTEVEVEVLCELGADANALVSAGRAKPLLPMLFHAVHWARPDLHPKLIALLRAGADPLAVDTDGYMPFHHLVEQLCSNAADRDGAWDAFFAGFASARSSVWAMPREQQLFLAHATPVIRRWVEAFAAGMALPATSKSKVQRASLVEAIVTLGVYETWAVRNRAEGDSA